MTFYIDHLIEKIVPTGQTDVREIFVEHSHEYIHIFINIFMYSQNIRKKFLMKFREIFPNNFPGTLNIGIFPDCSMNILRMLHVFS